MHRTLLLLSILALAMQGAGCSGAAGPRTSAESQGSDTPVAPITNTDPCATRLHDLSGALLFYLHVHGELPPDLQTLAAADLGPPLSPLACPVSNQPYVYNPSGIYLAEQRSYVVLFDPAPSHSRMRWAITVEEPADGGLPITKVVALPESFFLLRPPQ